MALVVAASADYVVEPGDTLAGIAREHGVSVEELAEANDIANPNLIRIGQQLLIPGEDAATGSYVVEKGDTLASIAAANGTTVRAIVDANDLRNPNLVYIGQTLTIPGATPPVASTHTVQPGETLAMIAARYGVTVAEIAAANGITNTALIYAGTTLRIHSEGPVDEGPVVIAGSETVATHTVTLGQTLASIARTYGTTVDRVVEANGIRNPNLIRVGQQLEVPGTGWVCPVKDARYFNDWGFPRDGGRKHEGNDLFASAGTPVVAPVSGRVEAVTGKIGGLQFRLWGDDGNLYIGSHMDGFGQVGRVTAGAVIGSVGTTGNARGSQPHLHFEIHPGDRDGAVNPYPTLQHHGC